MEPDERVEVVDGVLWGLGPVSAGHFGLPSCGVSRWEPLWHGEGRDEGRQLWVGCVHPGAG